MDTVAVTGYAGLAMGTRPDKSGLFEVHFGELENAPLIRASPLSMEFRLRERFAMTNDTLFLGELVTAWTEERFLTNGHVDVEKGRPFPLIMPGIRYRAVGELAGKAWQKGKSLRKFATD